MQPAAPVVPKVVEEAPAPSPKKQDDGMPLYFREGASDAGKAEDKPKEVVPSTEPEKISARAEVTFKVLGKIELDGKGNPVPPKPVTPPVEPKAEPKVESVIVETPVVETKAPEVPQPIAAPTETPAPVAPTGWHGLHPCAGQWTRAPCGAATPRPWPWRCRWHRQYRAAACSSRSSATSPWPGPGRSAPPAGPPG